MRWLVAGDCAREIVAAEIVSLEIVPQAPADEFFVVAKEGVLQRLALIVV